MGETSFREKTSSQDEKARETRAKKNPGRQGSIMVSSGRINGLQYNENTKFIFRKTPSSYTTDNILDRDKSGIKGTSQKATAIIVI